jgi:hypothetical protein
MEINLMMDWLPMLSISLGTRRDQHMATTQILSISLLAFDDQNSS